ncbi:MAG: hypothetical protein ABEI98_00445 [Halorhabdus sp.]
MALYAVDRIDDAVDMTRSFLTPVETGRWGRLVVIVAFLLVGTGGGGASTASNVPTTTGSVSGDVPAGTMELPDVSATAIAILVGVFAVLLLLGLLAAAIGAIMEFVFVESLSNDEIHVRRYARRYAGKGLRLFAFRLLLGIVTVVILGATVLLLFGDVIAAFLAGDVVAPSAGRLLAGVVLLGPFAVAVGTVVALANGFTTEFVVPIMLREGRGVIAGWQRLWPTLREQWTQYGAYVLIAFGLHIVTGIAGSILVGITAVALALPFLLVAVPVGFGLLGGGTVTVGAIVLLGALVLVYVLVVFIAAAVIYVPITVFHRQFALLVLGDTNSAFDVLTDRRPSAA